jgi:hypothetical protein
LPAAMTLEQFTALGAQAALYVLLNPTRLGSGDMADPIESSDIHLPPDVWAKYAGAQQGLAVYNSLTQWVWQSPPCFNYPPVAISGPALTACQQAAGTLSEPFHDIFVTACKKKSRVCADKCWNSGHRPQGPSTSMNTRSIPL